MKSLTQFCPAGVSLNAFTSCRGRGGVPGTDTFRYLFLCQFQPQHPSCGIPHRPKFQPAQCSSRAGQQLQPNRGLGLWEQGVPGTPRCHIHPRIAAGCREGLRMLQPEQLCHLGGLWAGPWPGEASGWERGRGAAGAQPGGPSWAQPRAARLVGCRRPAGLGAGRLSIFSEGFIEWIPAVWLHTEILS